MVHFIGCFPAKPSVRTAGIVPIRNRRKLLLEFVVPIRNQHETGQQGLHRQDESLHDGDRPALANGAIARLLDPLAAAPGTEARAVELPSSVTDDVLGESFRAFSPPEVKKVSGTIINKKEGIL